MKNIYSKIVSCTISVFILCIFASAFAKERISTIQIGVYVGPVLFLNVSDAKGTPTGQTSDTKINDVKIEQNFVWGFNGRYYFHSSRFGSAHFDTGIDTDIGFSSVEIAKDQTEVEIDMISLTIGPIFRYQEKSGIFGIFNPYVSPFISLHYGQYGSSSLSGKGYGLKLGTEYFVNENYGFILEGRYADKDLVLGTYDNFVHGMNLKTRGGSILIGSMWNF
jgi:hypothetical protein